MCVKIVRLKSSEEYDTTRPLEEQLRGSKQVIINYSPKDPAIDHFLGEVERLCKTGVTASLNIQFNHNNQLTGAKIHKQLNKLAKDLDLNEVIKFMVKAQAEADKKIDEMIELCRTR